MLRTLAENFIVAIAAILALVLYGSVLILGLVYAACTGDLPVVWKNIKEQVK